MHWGIFPIQTMYKIDSAHFLHHLELISSVKLFFLGRILPLRKHTYNMVFPNCCLGSLGLGTEVIQKQAIKGNCLGVELLLKVSTAMLKIRQQHLL